MANVFDQFDSGDVAVADSVNVFDQFGEATRPNLDAMTTEDIFALARGAERKSIPVGRFASGVGQGLQDIPAGALQTAADVLGAEQLSEDIARGQQAAALRQQQQGAPAQVGRFIGQTAPLAALPIGGAGIARTIAAGAGVAGITPEEEILDQSQSLLRRAEKAALGGAIGGAIGGAAAVGRGVKSLLKGRDADKILARRISQFDPRELKADLQAGKISVLPDVAGDEIKGLTRQVAKQSGGAKDIVVEFFEGRADDSVKRVTDQLSKRVSNVDSYFGKLDDMAAARAQTSAPLYKQAYIEGAEIPQGVMKSLYTNKFFKSAANKASRLYGLGDDVNLNSVQALDAIKKVLDDDIMQAARKGRKNFANQLRDVKKQVVNIADNASPTYSQARKIFSDFASIEDAQKQGLAFSNLRPEQIRRYVKGLGPSEKEGFLIGVRENLQKTASSTADGSDAAKRIFGIPYKREQLKAAIQDPKTFNAFEKRMEEEIRSFDTFNKVLGGSRTDINVAETGQELIEATITEGQQGLKNKLVDSLAYWFKNRYTGLTDKNAAKLAKTLTSKDAGIEVMDRIIKAQDSALQKRVLLNVQDDLPVLLGVTTAQQVGGGI